jgi:hypothetical protein
VTSDAKPELKSRQPKNFVVRTLAGSALPGWDIARRIAAPVDLTPPRRQRLFGIGLSRKTKGKDRSLSGYVECRITSEASNRQKKATERQHAFLGPIKMDR